MEEVSLEVLENNVENEKEYVGGIIGSRKQVQIESKVKNLRMDIKNNPKKEKVDKQKLGEEKNDIAKQIKEKNDKAKLIKERNDKAKMITRKRNAAAKSKRDLIDAYHATYSEDADSMENERVL